MSTSSTITNAITSLSSSLWNSVAVPPQNHHHHGSGSLLRGRVLVEKNSPPLSQTTIVVGDAPLTAMDVLDDTLVISQASLDEVRVYGHSNNKNAWSKIGEAIRQDKKGCNSQVSIASNKSLLAVSCPLHAYVHLYTMDTTESDIDWVLDSVLEAPEDPSQTVGDAIQLSMDGKRLAISTDNGSSVHWIDLVEGTDTPMPLYGAASYEMSKNGQYLLVDDGHSVARVYEWQQQQPQQQQQPSRHGSSPSPSSSSVWVETGPGIFDYYSKVLHDMDIMATTDGLPRVAMGAELEMEDGTTVTELRVYDYKDDADTDGEAVWHQRGSELALVHHQKGLTVKLVAGERVAVSSPIVNNKKKHHNDEDDEEDCLLQVFRYEKERDEWTQEYQLTYTASSSCNVMTSAGNKLVIAERTNNQQQQRQHQNKKHQARIYTFLDEDLAQGQSS